MRRSPAPVLVLAFVVAACTVGASTVAPGSPNGPSPSDPPASEADCSVNNRPTSPHVLVPASEYTLGISNGTALAVTLLVNGGMLKVYVPGTGDNIPSANLPPLPWAVEARTSRGRLLLTMAAHEGDLWREPCANNGLFARRDLSCGRLDLWSIFDASGPVPGPGMPGDCEP